MTSKRHAASPLTMHRRRQAARGLRRVEVQVPQEDVALLRRVAAALNDPRDAVMARAYLVMRFEPPPKDFKEFLTWGPSFEGLDLERSPDTVHEIEW